MLHNKFCLYDMKLIGKIFHKKKILFSKKDEWEGWIRKNIKGYVPFFHEFNEIDLNDFDLVVPLTIHAQKYINAHPELLTEQKALIPSNYCIDLCNDKESLQYFLAKNGFEKFTPKINGNLGSSYILKKKIGAWGEGISIINDSETERAHISEIESGDYFKQEYIEGQDEYSAHIIFSDKKVAFLRTLKFTFRDRYFVRGKNFEPISTEVVDHSLFKGLFKDILDKLVYQGICCFNYKIVNHEPKIFEINPRYGGTMTRFINEALSSYRRMLKKHAH